MFIQQSISNLVEELNQVIGDKVIVDVNAYVQHLANSEFCLFLDPSGLTDKDETILTDYAKKSGLVVDDVWNDWGRFIKIMVN